MTITTPSTRLALAASRTAVRCADAWSYDAYASWYAVAKALFRMDFTELEVETIMRSKITRWAGDMFASPTVRYGRFPARIVTEYLRDDFAHRGEHIVRAEIAEWVYETFAGSHKDRWPPQMLAALEPKLERSNR